MRGSDLPRMGNPMHNSAMKSRGPNLESPLKMKREVSVAAAWRRWSFFYFCSTGIYRSGTCRKF